MATVTRGRGPAPTPKTPKEDAAPPLDGATASPAKPRSRSKAAGTAKPRSMPPRAATGAGTSDSAPPGDEGGTGAMGRGRGTGTALVVVESPTKARTISTILGPRYLVMASKGHVVDLPEHGLGYDEGTFEPIYEVAEKRKKDIAALKDAARQVDRVIIATDPDREGEAIGWHVARQLGAKDPDRLEFHEITPKAVREALANPRRLDLSLVDAQQARRVLDRMVGYKASPALWRTVKRGLSAGRVQSVAMALVADREREIEAFTVREYWTVHLLMRREDGTTFGADLRLLDGSDIRLQDDKPPLLADEVSAQAALDHALERVWRVEKVDRSTHRRKPNPPFITSTLQQAAGSLGFGPKRTMSAAQSLYEHGLITYMRTDSVAISADALTAAREAIVAGWGADFVPKDPRHYTNKAGAQGAHECIRPTEPARAEAAADLDEDARRLYRLIRARFLACQAADAVYDRRSADITDPSCGCAARARSSRVVFPGWLAVSGIREDEDEGEGRQELPDLVRGEGLGALPGQPPIDRHETQPPPRFTEASLIKALEERGVGRPSTYAPTVEAIVDRGYAVKEGRALRATPEGLTVTKWARERLPDLSGSCLHGARGGGSGPYRGGGAGVERVSGSLREHVPPRRHRGRCRGPDEGRRAAARADWRDLPGLRPRSGEASKSLRRVRGLQQLPRVQVQAAEAAAAAAGGGAGARLPALRQPDGGPHRAPWPRPGQHILRLLELPDLQGGCLRRRHSVERRAED